MLLVTQQILGKYCHWINFTGLPSELILAVSIAPQIQSVLLGYVRVEKISDRAHDTTRSGLDLLGNVRKLYKQLQLYQHGAAEVIAVSAE